MLGQRQTNAFLSSGEHLEPLQISLFSPNPLFPLSPSGVLFSPQQKTGKTIFQGVVSLSITAFWVTRPVLCAECLINSTSALLKDAISVETYMDKEVLTPHRASHFFQRMVEESVNVGGEEILAIRHAARKFRMVLSVGISEKRTTATLFNSNLIIATDGQIVVHHRKLVPTFYEKLTWSPGDGSGLRLASTPFGQIGALICGDNTNPLARYALMALGEQVHISSWPAIWPTRRYKHEDGKANSSPIGNYNNVAANYIRSAAHCFEAKCFGISCAGYLSNENMDEILSISGDPSCLPTLREAPRAASMFLGPAGSLHQSFTIDEHTGAKKAKEVIDNEEEILYAYVFSEFLFPPRNKTLTLKTCLGVVILAKCPKAHRAIPNWHC